MAETTVERFPESLGPGTDAPNGSVAYGQPSGVTVVHDGLRTQEERAADLASWNGTGCARCHDIPDDVIAPLAYAFAQQKQGARR